MPAPIIYLNGWPGVGKHTIAKEIEKQLGGKGRIIHHHQHIDLAGAILPRSSPQYQDLRFYLRRAIFDTLATAVDTFEYIYVITDSQTSNPAGLSVQREHAATAKARGCAFIPVLLACSPSVNAERERLRSEERVKLVEEGKGILLDTNVLAEMREEHEMLMYDDENALELDVSAMEAREAARVILRHVSSIVGTLPGVRGYS